MNWDERTVLLRNHGMLLPLERRSVRRVALIGPEPDDLPGHVLRAETEDAAAVARDADIAIVVVDTPQDDLVRGVNAAQPRTIAVVDAGKPVALPWLDEVPAVLLTWFPGLISGVLFGDAEPGGRLPAPRDGLPLGHGLGYTTWEYLAMDGARVRLVNTGTRRGREVVQIFADGTLAGHAVVEADPGQEVVVDVPVKPGAGPLQAGRS